MSHQIKLTDRVTVCLPDGSKPDLRVQNIKETIQLATMLTFNDWMDATNASGNWTKNQTNHEPEENYNLLENEQTPLALKFNTAVHIFYQRGLLVTTK